MDITAELTAFSEAGSRLEHCARVMDMLGSQADRFTKRDLFLTEASQLGMSTEGLTDDNPLLIANMSTEAAEETLKSGASLIERFSSLVKRFAPTIKSSYSTISSVYSMISDMKKTAAMQKTATNTETALHGLASVHGVAEKGAKASIKAVANTKQIKMILIAMTAAMAFVGYAMTSLVSTIKKKEGIPTLSEKLSAKLRSIRWPFGDLGLSNGSGHAIGLLTVDGRDATTVEEDARSQLTTSPEMGVTGLSGLPDQAPADPFGEQQYDQTSAGLFATLKAHPILSIGATIAMIVGVFALCSKVVSYIVKGGAKLARGSLKEYADALKVRPLK